MQSQILHSCAINVNSLPRLESPSNPLLAIQICQTSVKPHHCQLSESTRYLHAMYMPNSNCNIIPKLDFWSTPHIAPPETPCKCFLHPNSSHYHSRIEDRPSPSLLVCTSGITTNHSAQLIFLCEFSAQCRQVGDEVLAAVHHGIFRCDIAISLDSELEVGKEGMWNLVAGEHNMRVFEEMGTEHVRERMILLLECEDGCVGSAGICCLRALLFAVPQKEQLESIRRIHVCGRVVKEL